MARIPGSQEKRVGFFSTTAFSGPNQSAIISKDEARLVKKVNKRNVVTQSQHVAIRNQSVFGMSGRQRLSMRDGRILEALSGRNEIEGRPQR
jgi:hypothetical protein